MTPADEGIAAARAEAYLKTRQREKYADEMFEALEKVRGMIDVSLIRTNKTALDKWRDMATEIDAVIIKAGGSPR